MADYGNEVEQGIERRDERASPTGGAGTASGKSRRGFASMDRSRQREIASKGGRAAHAKGTAHEWSSDEARNAGQKGGISVSRDRAHMAAIGREGGESRSRANRAARAPMSDRELARPVTRDGGGVADVRRADAPRLADDRPTMER